MLHNEQLEMDHLPYPVSQPLLKGIGLITLAACHSTMQRGGSLLERAVLHGEWGAIPSLEWPPSSGPKPKA